MRHDVIVIGDGPAGSALAAALHRRAVDVLLVGSDQPWGATYGTWADDVEQLTWFDTTKIWADRLDAIAVDVGGHRVIQRPYGVVDNAALRSALRQDLVHTNQEVSGLRMASSPQHDHHVMRGSGDTVATRVVVDATGWPGWTTRLDQGAEQSDVARQTAYGVVLAERPVGTLGDPMLMDFRQPAMPEADHLGPSFAYALPVSGGWLVEETVLASRRAVDPDALVGRLAARLGLSVGELNEAAIKIERVDIPMGGRLPDRSSPLLAFGAAASMIHPATGYSLATSLERAESVAGAIGEALGASLFDHRRVWDVIWSSSARRTRVLHDYGLDVLVDLDLAEMQAFFASFFDLDVDDWSAYLRITTLPTEMARIMSSLFRAAPWRLRRRLVSQNPLAFARLLRPQ